MAATRDELLGYFREENTREGSDQHHVFASGVSARSGSVTSFFSYIHDARIRAKDATVKQNLHTFDKFMQIKTGSNYEQSNEVRCHASCGEPMAIARAIYSGVAPENIVLSNITHIASSEARAPCRDFCQQYIVRGPVRGQWRVNWRYIQGEVRKYKDEMEQKRVEAKARAVQQQEEQARRDAQAAKDKAIADNPFLLLDEEDD